MKRFVIFFLTVCILLMLSPAVFAQTADVVDNGDVLSGSQETMLSNQAAHIAEEYGISVILLTETDLNGSTYTMADNHFYGGDHTDGILFLLVIESRDWEIATYGDALDFISDSDTEDLFDAARDDLADDRYYEGFSAYLDALDSHLSAATTSGGDSFGGSLLFSLVIGLVVALIALLVMRSKMNTVRAQRGASNYMVAGSYQLTRQRDLFLYSNTTRTRRAQNNSSGGSGGSSRGGSRGKF